MNPVDASALEHHAALDARLVDAVRNLRLLQSVSWPQHVQQDFLAAWRGGRGSLPVVEYAVQDLSGVRREIEAIAAAADAAHPIGLYLQRTAGSWIVATLLLESLGTAAVTEHSVRLFGRPGDKLPGDGPSNLEAARHFIELADELDQELGAREADYVLSAQTVQEELQLSLDRFFTGHKVTVELDPELIAKAAAGPTRIRLRSGTGFSEYDRHQLLEHEAYVHTLTALNGREQPHFKSLARNSPAVSAPGAVARRPMAMRSTAGQSMRPARACRSSCRPTTVAAAPSAEPMRMPACHARSSRQEVPARVPLRSVMTRASRARPTRRPKS